MKNNYAVIGMGMIYPRHKKAIQDTGGEIAMTCDIDPSKGALYTDWYKMFNSAFFEKIDSVVVCTPNYLHSIITREALMRGKKVLCEKPLSINGLEGMQGAKTVLQLRYHKEIQKINRPKTVHVEAKMFRDKVYWDSWKGDNVMSGGVLYNLGVHYIDLLIFLLGDSWKILDVKQEKHAVSGKIQFGESLATFNIEIVNDRENQGRILIADGKEIVLSTQDNLSYEDLHTEVYREFIAGRGIGVEEAGKSLKLIKSILGYRT